MNLKEKIENDPFRLIAVFIIVGFLSGIAVYDYLVAKNILSTAKGTKEIELFISASRSQVAKAERFISIDPVPPDLTNMSTFAVSFLTHQNSMIGSEVIDSDTMYIFIKERGKEGLLTRYKNNFYEFTGSAQKLTDLYVAQNKQPTKDNSKEVEKEFIELHNQMKKRFYEFYGFINSLTKSDFNK